MQQLYWVKMALGIFFVSALVACGTQVTQLPSSLPSTATSVHVETITSTHLPTSTSTDMAVVTNTNTLPPVATRTPAPIQLTVTLTPIPTLLPSFTPTPSLWPLGPVRIAYTHDVCDENGFCHGEIHISNLDGSDLVQIQPNGDRKGYSYGDPAWSPDGHWIAFYGIGDPMFGHEDIYIVKADGTHLSQLTYMPKDKGGC